MTLRVARKRRGKRWGVIYDAQGREVRVRQHDLEVIWLHVRGECVELATCFRPAAGGDWLRERWEAAE